jgi:phosphonate degradation associated HDIG domain protein
MSISVEQITRLLELGGSRIYGQEAVSQLEHALQCAWLAEEAGYDNATITASLLHDIGHLLYNLEESVKKDLDFRHEERGANYLSKLFGPAVTEPVRLHVPAKRYLCYTDKNYWEGLSPASKRSLELQGGVFSAEEAAAFLELPYAGEAIQLRQWDDQAKVAGLVTPDLAHFTKYIEACI